MKFIFRKLILLGIILFCPAIPAAGVGEEIQAFTLNDQINVAHTLDDTILRIYATADRKADGLMKTAMRALKQSNLDTQKAIVVADISAAPGFVKRLIRSSFKDRSYTTWMDVSGSTRTVLPYRPDHVTVVELNRRRITAIRYIADADILMKELEPIAPKLATKPDQK